MILHPDTVFGIESELLTDCPQLGHIVALYQSEHVPQQMRKYDAEYGGHSSINSEHKINYMLFLLEAHDWEVANASDFALPVAPNVQKLQTEPATLVELQAALLELIKIVNQNANLTNDRVRREQPYGLP